ncbi:glycoside hydrolase family 43 protein [Leifsonia sp. NPDC058292]|uniref:glycoside hydrolase family 43 protein n=1 Tax=Leifsonia sp. NPDC058292 TaxID=3346428 RepID=UPI0036DC8C79
MRSRAIRAALACAGAVAVAGLAAGCTSGGAPASGESASTGSGTDFVIDQDFADPGVIVDGDTAYAFATNTPGFAVRAATSHDMRQWTVSDKDALTALPAWASPGKTWAPDVVKVDDGYVMYLTAKESSSAYQCIGTATSSTAGGPYTGVGAEPLVCPHDAGGAIDASTFRDDDGALYLVWKTDGNCCGLDTWIELAPLSADGLSLTGPAVRLLDQGRAWEGDLIEAPYLVKRSGEYVLFYSANDYATDRYAIGVATASALAGPYQPSDSPFLSTESSKGRYLGPGGQSVVTLDGKDWLVFHSWDEAYSYRGMVVRPLAWAGATPSLG